ILHNDMTVNVPSENAEKVGLRKVIGEDMVKVVLKALTGGGTQMPKNWNRRFKHNRDKMKTGDILELAEVVRNLSLRDREKGLSTGEKQMFVKAKKILASELMYVKDMDEEATAEWLDGVLAGANGCSNVSACIAGGATRGESVRLALAEVPGDAAVVVVHDAARPFVVDEVIGRVLEALNEGWDGAVPVLPVSDTVKRVDGDRVVETLDRSQLRLVQTPQAFVAPVLRDAFAGDVSSASDCASLVEARGGRVKAVLGDPRLAKVTDAADLERAAALL